MLQVPEGRDQGGSHRLVQCAALHWPVKSNDDDGPVLSDACFGVRLTCLKSSTDLPLKSNNASAIDKFVDAFGNNNSNSN